jgi:hypothetical protein
MPATFSAQLVIRDFCTVWIMNCEDPVCIFILTAVACSEVQLSLLAPLLELVQPSHDIRHQFSYTYKTPGKIVFVYIWGLYYYIHGGKTKHSGSNARNSSPNLLGYWLILASIFGFVSVVSNYLNVAIFSKDLLAIILMSFTTLFWGDLNIYFWTHFLDINWWSVCFSLYGMHVFVQ